jgi:UDP-glucose 4-epimerase
MHILVVGGAGYIGSHVALRMIEGGHRVTVYDDMRHGLHANLHPGASFIHGTTADGLALRRVLGDGETPVDAVIHLAAEKAAGVSMVEPERFATNNITGTIELLNAMSDTGVRKLVFSSSAAVYGDPQYLPLDENHPTEPINFYGFTKLAMEQLFHWFDQLRSIRYASLRYFNAAGYDGEGRVHGLEQNPNNLIPLIMEVAIGTRPELKIFGDDYDTGDGTCIRDYIHVTDLAEAHALALSWIVEHDESLVLNLGTGDGTSVQEMVTAAREVTGKPIPARVTGRRPGDPDRLIASSARAAEVLGWTPTHSSAENLLKTTWDAYLRSAK